MSFVLISSLVHVMVSTEHSHIQSAGALVSTPPHPSADSWDEEAWLCLLDRPGAAQSAEDDLL